MANNIFTDIATGKPTSIQPSHYIKAREWFRQAAQKITDLNPATMFKDKQNLVKNINISSVGSMYLYTYDPKWKAKLPYYDTYPLAFIVEIYRDGWLGLNLHYLPPAQRAKLMNGLYDLTIKENDRMKVQISYAILKGAAKSSLFKPCVKRYLRNHVKGRLLFIEPDNWDMAMMLPTARWVGGSPYKE